MISASAGLVSHLAQRTTRLAWLWEITRTDGAVFRFTSEAEDIERAGYTYAASYGFSPSALQASGGLAVGNAEGSTVFYADGMTADDLRAGLWDHAEIRTQLVRWDNPAAGVIKMMRGWLGEVKHDGVQFTVEFRGLADRLNRSVGAVVQPGCDATLGDTRCAKALTAYTVTGAVVTAVTSARVFDTDLPGAVVALTDSSTGAPTADYFAAGKLTWTSGANAGRSMEVKTNDAAGIVELQLPMVDAIAPGDEFTVIAGCNKSREQCAARFDNVVNFRGFPDLPGMDRVLRVGGQ